MTELFPVQGVIVSNHENPEKYAVAWSELFNLSYILWQDVKSTYKTYLSPGTLVEYDVEILDSPVQCYRRISSRGHELRAPKGYGHSKSPDSLFKNGPVAHYSGSMRDNYQQRVEWKDSFVLKSTQEEDNLYIAKGNNLTAELPLSDAMRLVSANIISFTAIAEVKSEALGDDRYFWRIKEYVNDGKCCTLDEMLSRRSTMSFHSSSPEDSRRKTRTSELFDWKDERSSQPRRRNFTTAVMKPIMTKTTDMSFRIPEKDMSIFVGLVVNFDMVWIVYSLNHSEFVKIDGSVEMRTGCWYKFKVYNKDPCSHVLTKEHFIYELVVPEPPDTLIRFLPTRVNSRSGLVILVTIITPKIDEESGDLFFEHPIIPNMMSSEELVFEAHEFLESEVLAELACLNTGWEVMKIHEKTPTSRLDKLVDPFFLYEFKFYDEYVEQLRILEELQELKRSEDSSPRVESSPTVSETVENPEQEPRKPIPTIANDLFSFIHRLNIEADKKLGVVNVLTKTLETENKALPDGVMDSKENYMTFLREKFYEKSDIDDRLKLCNVVRPDAYKTIKKNGEKQVKRRESHLESDCSSYSSLPSSSKDATDTNRAEPSQARNSAEGDSNLDGTDLSNSVFLDDEPSNSASQHNLDVSPVPPTTSGTTELIDQEVNIVKEETNVNCWQPSESVCCFVEERPEARCSTSTENQIKRLNVPSSFFPRASRSKRVIKSLRAESQNESILQSNDSPDESIIKPNDSPNESVIEPREGPSDEKCDPKLVQRELSEDLKLLSSSEEELQSLPTPSSPSTPPPYIPLIGEEIMDEPAINKEEPIGIIDDQRFAVGLVVKEYASFVLLYSPDRNFNTILVKRPLLKDSPFEKAGLSAKLGVWMKIDMVQPRRPRVRDVEHPPFFSHIAISPPEPFDIQSIASVMSWKQRFFNGVFETFQTVHLNSDEEISTVTFNGRICYHVQSAFTVWVMIPMERLELLVQGGFSKVNCKISFWVTRVRCDEVNALLLCDNQPIEIENEDGSTDRLKGKFDLGVAEETNAEAMELCLKSLPPLRPKFSDKTDVKIISANNSLADIDDSPSTLDSRSISKQSSVTPNATSTPVGSDDEDEEAAVHGVNIDGFDEDDDNEDDDDVDDDDIDDDDFDNDDDDNDDDDDDDDGSDDLDCSNEIAMLDTIDYPSGDLRQLFIHHLKILFHPRVMEALEEQELLSVMPYLAEWRTEMEEMLELQ